MKTFLQSLILILVLACTGQSQYLEVRRTAIVKEDPTSGAQTIERVNKGDLLRLLNDGKQENGYYRVNAKSVDKEGWIYRTLESEYDYQNADEQVDENIEANEYTFTAEGRRFG